MKVDELVAMIPDAAAAPDALLTSFEDQIGFGLPADYREFIQHSNGGQLTETVEVRWASPGYVGGEATMYLDRLLALNGDPVWTAVRLMDVVLADMEHPMTGIPNGLVAIGDDGCGNLLTMRLGEELNGEVGFMDHETMGDAFTDVETYERVAGSFGDFVGMLKAMP